MNIILKLLKPIFKSELLLVYNNEAIVNEIFENFKKSFSVLNIFLKLLILLYIIFAFFFNLIFIIIFFFKLKLNFFYKVNLLLKKIPFVRNIQNFLIANLLLHTN